VPAGYREQTDGFTRVYRLTRYYGRSDRLVGGSELATRTDMPDHDDSATRNQAGESDHACAGGADGNVPWCGQIDSAMAGEPACGGRVEGANDGERRVQRRDPPAGLGSHRWRSRSEQAEAAEQHRRRAAENPAGSNFALCRHVATVPCRSLREESAKGSVDAGPRSPGFVDDDSAATVGSGT
jgi:hypothetical protein